MKLQSNCTLFENVYRDPTIRYQLPQYSNNDLFHKNYINDWRYVQGSNKKLLKRDIMITIFLQW